MRKYISLSGYDLKIIAVVLMLIDHAGAFLFPEIRALRIIGRISFPIFAYLICEGYEYTSDTKKYAMRLLIFALITEPFFNLAKAGTLIAPFDGQNVLFTFFIAIVTIRYCEKEGSWIWSMAGMIFANLIRCDYGEFGILLIMLLWYNRRSKTDLLTGLGCFAAAECFFAFTAVLKSEMGFNLDSLYYIFVNAFSLLAYFPLSCYNGKRGGNRINPILRKYGFYVIYPLQFAVFAFLMRAV